MALDQLLNVTQVWKEPHVTNIIPIVIIGGGGIAQSAHIPSYIHHCYPIAAICDLNKNQLRKCQALLKDYHHPNYQKPIEYCTSVRSLLSFIARNALSVVFDIATYPLSYAQILTALPPKSIVLLQKPFGYDLNSAKQLVKIINKKKFRFAVNFQLRFSSLSLFIRNVLETPKYSKLVGHLTDVELNLKCNTSWDQWSFLKDYDNIELEFHSIHYLDVMQSIFGVPDAVFADISNSYQMTAILKYSVMHSKHPNLKIRLHIDHSCKYQAPQALFNVNGTKAALLGRFDSMFVYDEKLKNSQIPLKDTMTVKAEESKKVDIPLLNSWLFKSFYGPMANLQRFVNGEDYVLCTNVDSVYSTALLVHALILSHQSKTFVDMKAIHEEHKISPLGCCQL